LYKTEYDTTYKKLNEVTMDVLYFCVIVCQITVNEEMIKQTLKKPCESGVIDVKITTISLLVLHATVKV